jgi:hypothetical protein
MSERYKCKLCEKDYLSMSARSNHVKRVHTINVSNDVSNVSNDVSNVSNNVSNDISNKSSINCKKCNKIFNSRTTRWRHEKACQTINNQSTKDTDLIELKEEMVELKKQMNKTTNNNIQNAKTINNNIDNKQIVINNFGNNNLDCLTDEFKKKLLKEFIFEEDHVNIIPTLIKKINFNPDYKENNNAKITNFKSKVGYKYEGKKWIAIEKEELLNKLYTMGDEYIDKIIDNLEHIPINIQEGYEEFQGKKDTLKKLMKQKIETTCYLYFKNCEDEF